MVQRNFRPAGLVTAPMPIAQLEELVGRSGTPAGWVCIDEADATGT